MKNEKRYRSGLTRQIVTRYFLTLFGFWAVFLLLILMSWQICNRIVWMDDNPLYYLLKFVEKYLIVFAGIPLMMGSVAITYDYMSKPLRYLDDVIGASEKLITSRESSVELPPAMKNIQDELNLFREQAIRSEYMAREAEQRKNDLIVYLAHDLKTPLTSVIGYLTLLRDEPQISQELRARYTEVALGKAERLEELINEFFDITRFNLTTLALEPERTNLSRMLEQIAFEFQPILGEKELTWHTEIQPDVEILCDRDMLERVFDNLIRNAVNYSNRNTRISLVMERLDTAVRILVRNHGKTISADKLARIFEQFFRLDSSRSSSTGGSGLGLAISKEIVELHGGEIWAESENGEVRFWVLLPDGMS